MQTPIEIRYEGTVIGTASSTSGSIDDGNLYLGASEPMPVGTKLELASGGEVTQVRVVRVAESSDPGAVGMIVRALSATEPMEIPMPPVAVVPPRPVTPAAPLSSGTRPQSSPFPVRGPHIPPASARPVEPPPGAIPTSPLPGSGPISVTPKPPGPPQTAVKGEIHRPSTPAPTHDDDDDGGVPEPIVAETSMNGSSSSSLQIEMSGEIDTGSTAELPAMGNGANKRRRSRRKR